MSSLRVCQILAALLGLERGQPLAHERGQHRRLEDPVQRPDPAAVRLAAAQDQPALGGEGAPAGRRRAGPGQLEDDVVAPAAPGEVLAGVVDDVVGAERPDQLQVPGAAHPGHLGAEPLGQLDGEGADAARRPDDQDLVARLDPSLVAQALQGGQGGQRDGRRLLEAEVGRLGAEDVLGDADVLGEAAGQHEGVDLVAGAEPGHGPADRLDLPGHVAAQPAVLGDAQPDRAHDVGQAAQVVPVPRVDGGGADAYQHLVAPPGRGRRPPRARGRQVCRTGDR